MSKAILCILDGWGIGQDPKADAIRAAHTPYYDSLLAKYPSSTLVTYGEKVGLPDGQMGNSEVGHLNIGAGRVVYQDMTRINKAIREGSLAENETLLDAIATAKKNKAKCHLIGLLSDGGVHAHTSHLRALVDLIEDHNVDNIFIHAFLDGRDTDPRSGISYLEDLQSYLDDKSSQLASVIGRYYAMDRDHNWDRIKKAHDLLTQMKGDQSDDIFASIRSQYKKDITDEFMPATVVNPNGMIEDGDVVICFNFRSDRPRQITRALAIDSFSEHHMTPLNLSYYSMTQYDASFSQVKVLFEKKLLDNTLGEVLESSSKTQLRIAETEKYAHVTYFFSGGKEDQFTGESRIMIPSPKVATYDLMPEMSAPKITDALLKHMSGDDRADFICVNYANADMVGHTGDFLAASSSVEAVDQCLARLCPAAMEQGYDILIIADHGNSDIMINPDGSPNTAHTTNLVPVIYLSQEHIESQLSSGKLADVAPTILDFMGLPMADEMDGVSLLSKT